MTYPRRYRVIIDGKKSEQPAGTRRKAAQLAANAWAYGNGCDSACVFELSKTPNYSMFRVTVRDKQTGETRTLPASALVEPLYFGEVL